LRRRAEGGADNPRLPIGNGRGLVVRLPYRAPFDWAAIVGFLETRATPGVEAVEDGSYRRTIEVDGSPGAIEIRPNPDEPHLLMHVRLPSYGGLMQVVERARRIFDLGADPLQITRHLRRSAILRRIVTALPGLRVPGAWDGFELAVRAVLGQQVTVRGATTLAGRLVETFGERVEGCGHGLSHLFPRPETLASVDVSTIGIPRARAATIRALASAVAGGALVLDASQGLEDAVARLCAIPGVGEWTAHYIAMRAFGEPDAFPSTDLGLRRALANGHGSMSAGGLSRTAEAWRPWRAYAAVYLWTAGAAPTNAEEAHP
jgi:AraC family transcriptional regulator of adaptative response / DNA-3-methyladenine glycosylase II